MRRRFNEQAAHELRRVPQRSPPGNLPCFWTRSCAFRVRPRPAIEYAATTVTHGSARDRSRSTQDQRQRSSTSDGKDSALPPSTVNVADETDAVLWQYATTKCLRCDQPAGATETASEMVDPCRISRFYFLVGVPRMKVICVCGSTKYRTSNAGSREYSTSHPMSAAL